MSLFGAMTTALSGLTSQSDALGNISDNIANSQTTGYKEVDTSFIDYVTASNATENTPGAVVAQPDYINNVTGTIATSSNPLAMAISGQGFFPVAQNIGSSVTTPTFSTQQYYTRAGDFTMNASGYLVNSAGDYLQGWPMTAAGTVNSNTLAPIQVSQAIYQPVATGNVTLAANLPPNTAATPSPITTNVSVYDSQGQSHQLTLSFLATAGTPDTWTVTATDDLGNTIGTGTVTFGANGTLASVTQGGTTQSTAGSPATLALATVYPSASGTQSINLNLGQIGSSSGLTQFAGTSFSLGGITQDGVPPGSFSSVSTTTSGAIVVNYDNGQSRQIGQVPLITFPAPDALQRQSGSTFSATIDSGTPTAEAAGSNGAGSIVTGSIEQSNVDIATQFSQLIVAQQAYSANAKMVTTASQMMQTTLDMKQ